MIKTDLIIIGAGPTGLFTVFEAGLLGMKCHLVDSLTKPGGQCVEIYPNKPIYDIPAHPEILAGKLVDNLLDQIKPFSPNFSLGEIAEELDKKDDHFVLKTNFSKSVFSSCRNQHFQGFCCCRCRNQYFQGFWCCQSVRIEGSVCPEVLGNIW